TESRDAKPARSPASVVLRNKRRDKLGGRRSCRRAQTRQPEHPLIADARQATRPASAYVIPPLGKPPRAVLDSHRRSLVRVVTRLLSASAVAIEAARPAVSRSGADLADTLHLGARRRCPRAPAIDLAQIVGVE